MECERGRLREYAPKRPWAWGGQPPYLELHCKAQRATSGVCPGHMGWSMVGSLHGGVPSLRLCCLFHHEQHSESEMTVGGDFLLHVDN